MQGGHVILVVMEYSNYKIAEGLRHEIDALKENLKDLERGRFSSGLEITLGTGDYDMGREHKVNVRIRTKVSLEIGSAIKDVIRNRIAELEKEFNEL